MHSKINRLRILLITSWKTFPISWSLGNRITITFTVNRPSALIREISTSIEWLGEMVPWAVQSSILHMIRGSIYHLILTKVQESQKSKEFWAENLQLILIVTQPGSWDKVEINLILIFWTTPANSTTNPRKMCIQWNVST